VFFNNDMAGMSTYSFNLGFNPSVGSKVILGIESYDNTQNRFGLNFVDDNQAGGGNTYTIDKQFFRSLNDEQVSIVSSTVVASSGTFTITVHLDAAFMAVEGIACEVTGLAASSYFDQSGTHEDSMSTTTVVTAAGATAQASEIVFSLFAGSTANVTPGGWTKLFGEDVNFGNWFGYKVISAIETSTVTISHDSNTAPFGELGTYRATVASGGCKGASLLLGVGGC
jgi:hypothetical protein